MMNALGYNNPSALVPAPADRPELIPHAGMASYESETGLGNFHVAMSSRQTSPEDSSAFPALLTPGLFLETMLWQIKSAIPIQGGFVAGSVDYNELSNGRAFEAAGAEVDARGRNDQTEYVGYDTGAGIFRVAAPTPPNLVLGFTIEWSLGLQNSAPFTMSIDTFNFRGDMYQPVDRKLDLRIGGPGLAPGAIANGGMIGVPFAQRLQKTDTCGYIGGGGCTVLASGGMQKAIIQPAKIVPYCNDPSPIFIPHVTIDDLADVPYIEISCGAALASAFTCQVRYWTAGSMALATARSVLYGPAFMEAEKRMEAARKARAGQ